MDKTPKGFYGSDEFLAEVGEFLAVKAPAFNCVACHTNNFSLIERIGPDHSPAIFLHNKNPAATTQSMKAFLLTCSNCGMTYTFDVRPFERWKEECKLAGTA